VSGPRVFAGIMASKLDCVLISPSRRSNLIPLARSSTLNPSSSGKKYLPCTAKTTSSEILPVVGSLLKISGARGVGEGVPVRVGVGEGVTGVGVLVAVGVGGINGR